MTERSESEPFDPEDRALLDAMQSLEPDAAQTRAMRARVLEAYEADHTSLAAEWLELLRVRPLAHGGWLLAAAAVLLAQVVPYLASLVRTAL